MPQIIIGPGGPKLDGSVKKAAYTFLGKLAESDATPGLHIEPIKNSRDSRIRTGRVNDFYRAVLVRLQGGGETTTYVYLGTFPHDDAIEYAKRYSVTINPVSGVAELLDLSEEDMSPPVAAPAYQQSQPTWEQPGSAHDAGAGEAASASDAQPAAAYGGPVHPVLQAQGVTLEDLVAAGIRPSYAHAAMAARSEAEILDLAEKPPAKWQGDFILDVACGTPIEQVKINLGLVEEPAEVAAEGGEITEAVDAAEAEGAAAAAASDAAAGADVTDAALVAALRHPAAQLEFAFIDEGEAGLEELRAAIEDEDFSAWRVFLHPQQRAYATRNRNGAFRLSGGAGTGKTVVLLHRARHLHRTNPDARIVLTTYNRTLAQQLEDDLKVLDPTIKTVDLGQPGIAVSGIDALVRNVLVRAGERLGAASGNNETRQSPIAQVLGERTDQVLEVTPDSAWRYAMDSVPELPQNLANERFLQAEYSLVVLPNRITTERGYLTVRRPGRGVALNRSARKAVWKVFEAYRSDAAANGTTDWDEKAVIAASYLDAELAKGNPRLADHVLVDEAQDLSSSRLMFLRALVSEGKNDLFLAEDAHQRIYAHKVTLSHYGINIRGRSRRLTLNYRTTEQNLRYAVGILDGEVYEDLEGNEAHVTGYRSARSGPEPEILACDSLGELYEAAAQRVQRWTSHGVNPSTIGLLCGTKGGAERLVRALEEHEVTARFIDRGASAGSAAGADTGVQVMTMHRAKGMEFSRVMLFDVSAEAHIGAAGAAEDDPQQIRSLLYVAATRARDELVVAWRGQPHAGLGSK